MLNFSQILLHSSCVVSHMEPTHADDILSHKSQQVGLDPAIISEIVSAGWTAAICSCGIIIWRFWCNLGGTLLNLLQKIGIRPLSKVGIKTHWSHCSWNLLVTDLSTKTEFISQSQSQTIILGSLPLQWDMPEHTSALSCIPSGAKERCSLGPMEVSYVDL